MITEIKITINKYGKDKLAKKVLLSHNNSSGVEFSYNTEDELKAIICNYIKNYIGGEYI